MTASGPVRVLWAIKGLGPGGAERLLVDAARAHDRARVSIDAAYLLPWKDHLVGDLVEAGVNVHRLSDRGQRDPRWPAALRRLIAEQRYDVVHTHSPMLAVATRLATRTLGRRRRPALLSTEHNVWGGHALVTRALNAVTWGLDGAHVAVSPDVAGSIWPSRRQPRIEVLVHGTDVAAIRDAHGERSRLRAEFGAADDDIVVGTVANLTTQKSYPDLLDAAALAVELLPALRFVAVGQGPLERELEQRRDKLGLRDRFSFLGYRRDVPAVLAGLDVFVLASVREGASVALMEAFAAGLPIVATDVPGTREMITDGVDGRLVPPRRPESLAASIVELAFDASERRRLGAAAARRSEDYDIGRAVRRLEDIYETLAST